MKKIAKGSALVMCLAALASGVIVTNLATGVDAESPMSGDLYGSARIKCTTARTADIGNITEINVGGAGNSDYSGTGIYLRMKNYTAVDTPITFKLNSTNGTIIAPTTSVNQTYYDADFNAVTGVAARAWGNYLMLPASFDGYVYMNYSTQMTKIVGDADFTPGSIWRIYIEYSGSYDSYADFAIGDIFTDEKSVLDASTLTEETFATTFVNTCLDYQSISQNERAPKETFVPSGDLNGGVHGVMNGYGGFMVKYGNLIDMSNGGTCVRIQNNLATTTWTMVHIASNWFADRGINASGAKIYRYDSNGENETEITVNEYGYWELPGNFDGYVYFPNNAFSVDWNSGYNPTQACAFYIEADTLDVNIGDIFSKDTVAFDGSEHYESEFGTWAETWTSATLSILPGFKEAEVVLYDYTQVTYAGKVAGGINITATANQDSSVFSPMTMTFEDELDLSAGEAVAINFYGVGSYAFQLELVDADGNTMQVPAKGDAAKKPIYMIKNGVATTMNHTTGDENTIHTIEGDGVIVLQKDFLEQKTGDTFDWVKVAKLVVRVHTFYDSGINIALGDIGIVDQTSKEHVVVFDVDDVEDIEALCQVDEYVHASKYFVPGPSSWIGDVKIIDSLNYKSDAELKKNVTYDIGDNACTYHKQDDGMFVHIGPYETGHTYGSYMCLGMFDKGVTTDRKQAYVEDDGVKTYAKGITFYAKNLSIREIGLTLQFDEIIPGKTNTERWCVKGYPAMYYAWDVKTDADYLMYAKSDQIQIPVGFEGYIRVPFTSYEVPDWNAGQAGVDQILDLDNFSGNFFLTSDNTRFADLEYFIKNVGLYFSETTKSNIFDSSHSIKNNMSLK